MPRPDQSRTTKSNADLRGRPSRVENLRISEVRFGAGGVPDWLEPTVRFCSRCGASSRLARSTTRSETGSRARAADSSATSTRGSCDDSAHHRSRRSHAHPPRHRPGPQPVGPAGRLLEIDETVREAAIRETLEETGLHVEPMAIVRFVFTGAGGGRGRGFSRPASSAGCPRSPASRWRLGPSPRTPYHGPRLLSKRAFWLCATGWRASDRTSRCPTPQRFTATSAPEDRDRRLRSV